MAVLPDDRAQSESLGTLLLVAVVTLSVGTFGMYYIATTTGGGAGGAAGGAGGADGFDFAVEATQDELRIAHNGGSPVATADLQVTVENATGEYIYAFDDGTVQGDDGDDRFAPGESWRLAWDQSPNTEVTVSLIDTNNERLLFHQSMTIESPVTERPANPAEGEETAGSGTEEPTGTDADSDDEGNGGVTNGNDDNGGDGNKNKDNGNAPDGNNGTGSGGGN